MEDRSGRRRMVEDQRGGGQKRQECRFPEVRRVGVRGRVRPRFFVGVGGRGRDVGRKT